MVGPAITAVVIARDEALHLGQCLDALRWADDRLVVLDSRTTDRSADIARERGVRVVVNDFSTFPAQRNAALGLVLTPWLLFVDADERTTAFFAAELRSAIARTDDAAPVGYWVPRRNFIWSGWIQHGGWFPDRQLRVLRVGRACYDEARDVHELVLLDGDTGRLRETLIHYNYDGLHQFLAKQRLYTTLEAQRLARNGIRAKPHNFVLQPLREFRRRFVELQGYHDGWRGLTLASLLSWYCFVTYVKLAHQSCSAAEYRRNRR